MLWKIVSAALIAGLIMNGTEVQAASVVMPNAQPTPTQTAAVRHAFGKEFADIAPFVVGEADLNGDGHPDLIVQTRNSDFCGGLGCSWYALLATANGYAAKGIDLGVLSFGTVTILDTVHHGMHDLRFDEGTHVFRWNGREYH
ncbi:MAG: hypothetical protein ACREFJ_00050 [Acetobacteraceae bacterium]